jgi:hypothetical protein
MRKANLVNYNTYTLCPSILQQAQDERSNKYTQGTESHICIFPVTSVVKYFLVFTLI